VEEAAAATGAKLLSLVNEILEVYSESVLVVAGYLYNGNLLVNLTWGGGPPERPFVDMVVERGLALRRKRPWCEVGSVDTPWDVGHERGRGRGWA
jgi:hypothetical protein